jgi:hypothetical protein
LCCYNTTTAASPAIVPQHLARKFARFPSLKIGTHPAQRLLFPASVLQLVALLSSEVDPPHL